jgi:multisubunit Na+/H+ antiporter MnhC subunit
MTAYILTFILFLVGLYGVITRRNLIKIAISLSIMEFSIFLLLVLIGFIDGGSAPIVDPEPGHCTLIHARRWS